MDAPGGLNINNRRTFYGLEGLRGAAALAVLLRHGADVVGWDPRNAHLAVDLFFILSGFVLAHAYERRLAEGMGAWTFLKLRLVRLYPLYLLALALALSELLVWRLLYGDQSWPPGRLFTAAVLNGLFLPAKGPGPELFPLDTPAWSLFFELVANVGYALMSRRLSTRACLIAVLIGATAVLIVGSRYGSLNVGWRWDDFLGGFARVLFGFPMGVLLFRLSQRWRLRVNGWIPMGLLAAALCVDAGGAQAIYEPVAVLLVMPVLVAAGAMTSPSGTSTRIFAFLGATSYAVYVLHVPLLSLLKWGTARMSGQQPADLSRLNGMACLVLVVGVAWLLHRYFDAPLRRRLRGGQRLRAGPR